ncbi:MAG: armadillo-type protein, partial [Olpidium bornovanus]
MCKRTTRSSCFRGQIFDGTLSPSPEVRAAAEQQIKQPSLRLGSQPHVSVFPLLLSYSPETSNSTRQAIAVYFKNRVQRSWDLTGAPEKDHFESSAAVIPAADKENVKKNILEALVRAPPVVRSQLVVCLIVILTEEFPEKWPEFVPTVRNLLSATNDSSLLAAGVHAFHSVVKVYQWRPVAKRGPLENVIRELFPPALEAGNLLVAQDNEQAAGMLRLLLKGYHASMQVFAEVFCGSRSLPSPPVEFLRLIRDANWNPGAARDILFAKQLVSGVAVDILRTYLMLADSYIQGKQWMSPVALHALAAFFDDAVSALLREFLTLVNSSVKHTATWKEMKPYVDVIVTRFIFPMLCFSDRDDEVWEDDAVEYVHKRLDPMEDYQS